MRIVGRVVFKNFYNWPNMEILACFVASLVGALIGVRLSSLSKTPTLRPNLQETKTQLSTKTQDSTKTLLPPSLNKAIHLTPEREQKIWEKAQEEVRD